MSFLVLRRNKYTHMTNRSNQWMFSLIVYWKRPVKVTDVVQSASVCVFIWEHQRQPRPGVNYQRRLLLHLLQPPTPPGWKNRKLVRRRKVHFSGKGCSEGLENVETRQQLLLSCGLFALKLVYRCDFGAMVERNQVKSSVIDKKTAILDHTVSQVRRCGALKTTTGHNVTAATRCSRQGSPVIFLRRNSWQTAV